jgi:hypothetical protein
MTLTAMLAPLPAVVRTAVHLALDPHHHEEASVTHDDLHDAATVVHGHGHEHGTPAHSHDATVAQVSSQAPLPSLTIHPSVAPFAIADFAAGAAMLRCLDPSPPPRAPIILRI